LSNQFNGMQLSRSAIGHVGAAAANYVALVTQQGLLVLDPLRGTELWKKIDVPPSARVFGDDHYLFAVDVGENGAIGSTRAFRASDGQQLNLKSFAHEYEHRVRVLGRRLLVHDRKKQELRLRDLVRGADIWSRKLPAGAVLTET